MAGMGLSGGFAAGAGADALEQLLKQAFVQQAEKRRAAQEDQRIAQDAERLKMAAADRAAAQADVAQTREQNAVKGMLTMTPPGTSFDPATAARARAAGFGASVQHDAADLPSTAISGTATAGAAAPIMGQLRMAAAGRPERDTFTGTADQQAAEQARTDRLGMMEQSRQDKLAAEERAKAEREAARVQSLADRKDLMQFAAQNRPAAQTHPRFNVVQGTDAEGKAALIRTNVDTGEVTVLPVPSGGAFTQRERPVTQDQTNLALYGKRVEQAEKTLKPLEDSISKMNVLSYEAQTRLDNPKLQSPEMQSYQQAARNFIAAVLRRESGAAISPTEFAEARKQYLPMPGDTATTLAQKAKNRQIVYDQFKQGAGSAWRDETKAAGSGFKVTEIHQ